MADRLSVARDYVAKKPADRFGLYTLAMELRKVQAWEECFATFDRLLELYPENGPGYYHYAKAKQESDDLAGARVLIERGIASTTKSGDGKTLAELKDLKLGLESLED
ncbi:MAG TPA: tetratricopeptide repeat protein [Myxococcota bacterium]|nr:tetratricopeptide repeat protein [Myxococcota bacterium]HNH46348.1 tetratricopeptide repeat protein [Myxococcota bacterium]